MIARALFCLLLPLCAGSVFATDNHTYKADEYATISGGRSPDGGWSVAAHGEGEAGYGKFDTYLMRESAHEEPAPLRLDGSLDTAPLSIVAVWAPDSRHVAILHRIDRHVLDVRIFAVAGGKTQPIKVPQLLDIVCKHHLKQDVHYELFGRLYRLVWEQADRFTLQEFDTFDAAKPIFRSGLERYVALDRLGAERVFTNFSAQATYEISAKGEARLIDVKALPQSSWSKTIVYSPHLLFTRERGLHNTETSVSSLDAQKDQR